jgi:hypothetical protein
MPHRGPCYIEIRDCLKKHSAEYLQKHPESKDDVANASVALIKDIFTILDKYEIRSRSKISGS